MGITSHILLVSRILATVLHYEMQTPHIHIKLYLGSNHLFLFYYGLLEVRDSYQNVSKEFLVSIANIWWNILLDFITLNHLYFSTKTPLGHNSFNIP